MASDGSETKKSVLNRNRVIESFPLLSSHASQILQEYNIAVYKMDIIKILVLCENMDKFQTAGVVYPRATKSQNALIFPMSSFPVRCPVWHVPPGVFVPHHRPRWLLPFARQCGPGRSKDG